MSKSGAVSLTEGNIRDHIYRFALPIFISNIFSELYNVTNSLIVGNFVSLRALSAVSACTWICNIFNYTFYGLGMGVGVIVAKYYGANDEKNLKKTLDSSIVFSVIGGLCLTVLAELFLPFLMRLCNIGGDIYPDALAYLRVYFLGSTAVLMYQMCFFVLRSFGDTKHQLYYSIISSLTNLIFGLFFVRILKLNVVGTAFATLISQFVMDFLALRLMLHFDVVNFDIKHLDFDFKVIKQVCALGIPASIQNMMIALSSMMVQSYVNNFSDSVIAGIGVAEKISNWGQMFSLAVSSASMSLVAQNVGAEKYDRVQESIRECIKISTVLTIISVIVIYTFAPFLLSLFNDDADTIRYGTEMIRYSIFGMLFVNLSHIYNGSCRGAGNVKMPMVIAIIGQVLCKFLVVYIGLKINYTHKVLYFGTASGYVMSGVLATIYFFTSSWVVEHGLRYKEKRREM